MKRSSIKHRKTKRGPEAQRHIDEFRERWEMERCWLCETRVYISHIHHIVTRKGDAWDDPRNLSKVCWLCHARIHGGEQTTVDGRKHPAWTTEDVERAKQRWDPDNWDPAYLDYLRNWEKNYRETGRMEYQE
jgi:hypothetical protein